MIRNFLFLIEQLMILLKKIGVKYFSTKLRDSKIADFTDFDQIFQLSQLFRRTLPILTKFIVLYRRYYT
jgi:hypothetical protein